MYCLCVSEPEPDIIIAWRKKCCGSECSADGKNYVETPQLDRVSVGQVDVDDEEKRVLFLRHFAIQENREESGQKDQRHKITRD